MVYVLPHRAEEFLKLGFSRDPLQRMQNLHARYYEFFDIERALLIETPRVREARTIETRLKRMLRDHRAPMPLDIRREAGGETEWYRRAYEPLLAAGESYESEGYVIYLGATGWVKNRLRQNSQLLYEWTSHQFRALHMCTSQQDREHIERTLKNALDAYRHFSIDVDDAVPPDVADWYRSHA